MIVSVGSLPPFRGLRILLLLLLVRGAGVGVAGRWLNLEEDILVATWIVTNLLGTSIFQTLSHSVDGCGIVIFCVKPSDGYLLLMLDINGFPQEFFFGSESCIFPLWHRSKQQYVMITDPRHWLQFCITGSLFVTKTSNEFSSLAGNFNIYSQQVLESNSRKVWFIAEWKRLSVISRVSQLIPCKFKSPAIQNTAFGCFFWKSWSCLQISSVHTWSLCLYTAYKMRVFFSSISKDAEINPVLTSKAIAVMTAPWAFCGLALLRTMSLPLGMLSRSNIPAWSNDNIWVNFL